MQIVPAVTVVDAVVARVGLLHAIRIVVSLSPLMAVHLTLLAAPWIEWSWWYVLWIVALTRIAGMA